MSNFCTDQRKLFLSLYWEATLFTVRILLDNRGERKLCDIIYVASNLNNKPMKQLG